MTTRTAIRRRHGAPRRFRAAGATTSAVVGAVLLAMTGPLALSARAQEAATDESTPAPYQHAEDAEPVSGTPGTADAPRIEVGSVYVDELGPGDEIYYSVVLDDRSDFYFSAVVAPDPEAKVAFNDEFSLQLQTTGGDTCFSSVSRRFSSDDATRPIGAGAFRTAHPDADCQEGGSYLLKVERDSQATSHPGAWPIELRVFAEPSAVGDTKAPPQSGWATPEDPPAAPTGEARHVTGGTGFNDAQPIEEGVWRDQLRPGETRFYRVPLDWHQQLAVNAEFGNAVVESDLMNYVSQGVSLELYTPFHALAVEGEGGTYNGDPAKLATLTAPVAYDNRYNGDSEYVARTRVSGWYYIAVHLHGDTAGMLQQDEVSLTLRLALHGDPSPGPEYQGEFSDSGFGVTEGDREQAREGKDDATLAAEERDGKRLLGFASIGSGTALLLFLGGWMWLARRRAAQPPTGGGEHAGPPGVPAAPVQ